MLTKYFLYLFREHLINQIVMPEIVRFYGIIIKMWFFVNLGGNISSISVCIK